MDKIETERQYSYLDLGVYASFDGYGIKLMTGHIVNPEDTIYINPEALKKLIKFCKDVKLLE